MQTHAYGGLVEITPISSLALSQALQSWDGLLEQLPVAIYICDRDGILVRYNRRAAELWGRSPALNEAEYRFCGAYKAYRLDGEVLPLSHAPMSEVLQTGKAIRDREVIVERPDGARITILANLDPLFDRQGQIIGGVNCFQDISARKEAEERVRQSQDHLRAVVETTPECVKIVAVDGTLQHMNAAGLKMIEADTLEAVEGKSVYDLIAPKDQEVWRHNHQRICRGEKLSWEFEITGLRGARRQMETHAAPLPLPDGTIVHLAVTRDVTQRKQDAQRLQDSERFFQQLLESLPAAVYTTDAAGRINFYNAAAEQLWGLSPALGEKQWCGSWRLYTADGKPMAHDQCPMAQALKTNQPIHNAEAIAERPDGTRVPFAAYPTPLHDDSGAMVGAVNMLVDITHNKEAAKRQQLLINELNHRVKNTLAIVQSIAAQSFRGEADNQAHRWFDGRLIALAKAHDVLTRENWEGAGLREIVAQATAHLRSEEENRFNIQGPEVRVSPKMALSLAMTLHELCTNAAKYGAFSTTIGQVSITWQITSREDGAHLELCWAESDGPPVKAPEHKGFGSRLIERGLAAELQAKVQVDYAPSGLVCRIDAPLS